MIDVKQAIKTAKDFAHELLGAEELLLEEVSSDDEAFEITLSLPRRAGAPRVPNPLSALNPFSMRYAEQREFKTFRVMKADGSVAKMSIREIA